MICMAKNHNIDIDITNFTLEDCIKLRDKLTRRIERTPAQIYLEENFFFMKEKNIQRRDYQERVIDRVAEFISEIYKMGFYDEEDFDYVYYKLSENSYSGYKKILRDSFTYFYNEAIPIEFKKNIFTYKRNHKKVDGFNHTVKHCILGIAKEYRNNRLGFLDAPKGK